LRCGASGGEKDANNGCVKGHGGRRGVEAPMLHVKEMEEEEAVAGGETHEGVCMNHDEVALTSW
jgi:hypothetical protein